jgi:hypothetical protein
MFVRQSSALMPLIHKKFTWQKPIALRRTYRPIRVCHRKVVRLYGHHLANGLNDHVVQVGEATSDAQEEDEEDELLRLNCC